MSRIRQAIHEIREYRNLPEAARREYRRDRLGLLAKDPGIERAIDYGAAWLGLAQDNSATNDGGVANLYSLINGWGPSYPETTGYIIPTMLEYSKLRGDKTVRQRAKRMLDWLVSIQFPDGGFQGGYIGTQPCVPVTFNTGQILLGLASGVREFGNEYYEPMYKAADWLVDTQDSDGCWRKHPSPFVVSGDKTYEVHVAWGLLEAARREPDRRYADAALANVHWALSQQNANGWFRNSCLTDPSRPLTHTLGYTLRGILEAYRYTGVLNLLSACKKTADGLLESIQKDGFLPGCVYPDWRGAVSWACLTGTVQIAHCWLLLYQFTSEDRYRDAAYIANRFVRRTMHVSGPPETRGAIKGSFPVNGGYHAYNYINWACKFFVDSNILEKDMRDHDET